MAKESQSDRTDKASLQNPMSAEFAAMGKKRVEEFTKVQTELLDKIQEANRQWVERLQSEANLASEFAAKLSAVRSVPDAMNVGQEWTSRRFEMMAEDGQRLFADIQKFMETAARLLSDGWQSGRPGVST